MLEEEEWMNYELASDEDIGGNMRSHSDNDFSDSDDEFIINSEHESNSELSDYDDENQNVSEGHSSAYFYGKNKFKWA